MSYTWVTSTYHWCPLQLPASQGPPPSSWHRGMPSVPCHRGRRSHSPSKCPLWSPVDPKSTQHQTSFSPSGDLPHCQCLEMAPPPLERRCKQGNANLTMKNILTQIFTKNMGIPILVRRHLYCDCPWPPELCLDNINSYKDYQFLGIPIIKIRWSYKIFILYWDGAWLMI